MVYTTDLKSVAERLVGSSPTFRTFTAVTQLAECQFSKLDVAGSTPACRTFHAKAYSYYGGVTQRSEWALYKG